MTKAAEEYAAEVATDVGANIRYLRKEELRLTRRHIEERCGVTKSHLARIEAGLANPTLNVLARLAYAMDVPEASFFGRRKRKK